MFAAARQIDGRMISSVHPASVERQIGRMGLSGSRVFSSIWLGGGTLINERFIGPLQLAREWNVPVATFGTGVGSSGLEQQGFDLNGWADILCNAVGVGVRGPLSVARLRTIGLQAEVVGDPALLFTLERPSADPSRTRRIAVNVAAPVAASQTSARDQAQAAEALLLEWASPWTKAGWQIVPIAMTPEDVAACRSLMRQLDAPDVPVHQPRDVAAFQRLVSNCSLMFAVRLHAVVLASTLGVPAVLVGYRGKCQDFMQSLDRDEWVINPADQARAVERGQMLADQALASPTEHREAVWSAARKLQETFAAYVQRVRFMLSNTDDMLGKRKQDPCVGANA
ncbi:MAG: polysaccharide pyruvyl transferase family protein [Firmicutes bacterium]|nr:polysaccharide pyruvyl transferase family protein [Bacillota bacterium]